MSPIPMADLVARLGRWSAGRGPLYLLLAARFRELIDAGDLPAGTALPTDRALAAGLAVGRTTVVGAYDLLRQEGRLARRQGSGTWVAPAGAPAPPAVTESTANPMFLHLLDPPDHVLQFACAGPPAPPPECAPAYRWAADQLAGPDLGYHPAGDPRLRRAIAARYTARGVPTSPEQVLVTTGGQQALALLTRALVAPGDDVLVEAPTFPGALELFREAAAAIRSAPAGEPDAYRDALRTRRPALAYVIAAFHNPTGSALPLPDRRALVSAAVAAGVPTIVDDVTADLDFAGPGSQPPTAAYAPAAAEIVTVGSLSKLVWGGMRVGWIRAQPAQVARLARLKAVHDLGSPVVDQLAAIALLSDLDDLVARRTDQLRRQHDHLCRELRQNLPQWRFRPAVGGQTLWVRLPDVDAAAYAQAALRHSVAVLPGGSLDPSGGSTDRLRLPYVAAPETISTAVAALAQAWAGFTSGPTTPRPLPAIAV
ncbi:PLP-dependent aminotransferase family protein [Actinomycetes bacterium KLBMP 9797]